MAETKKKLEQSLTLRAIPDAVTRNTILPFLEPNTLLAFMLTCKDYYHKYADKKIAAEMLNCVLNPTEDNQKRFLELLSVPKQDLNGPPLYLIRNHGRESYVNKKGEKKTKTIRRNTNVLEAILRTYNFHYAQLLFKSIPEKEKTQSLKRYIKEIKAQGIWGMSELQAAYKNFLDPWQALFDAKNWNELDRLSGRIGQSLKEHLPWFSICLFCHPATHTDTDYTKAPNWVCVLWDNSVLDLDLFGPGSICALYKGVAGRPRWGVGGVGRGRVAGAEVGLFLDSAAFTSQSEVLSSELDKTIKQFELDDSEPVVAAKPARG